MTDEEMKEFKIVWDKFVSSCGIPKLVNKLTIFLKVQLKD
jgi:hypothetical protein